MDESRGADELESRPGRKMREEFPEQEKNRRQPYRRPTNQLEVDKCEHIYRPNLVF